MRPRDLELSEGSLTAATLALPGLLRFYAADYSWFGPWRLDWNLSLVAALLRDDMLGDDTCNQPLCSLSGG